MLNAVDRQANPNYNDRHRKYQDLVSHYSGFREGIIG